MKIEVIKVKVIKIKEIKVKVIEVKAILKLKLTKSTVMMNVND